jgi:maleylpyruvate isomerase
MLVPEVQRATQRLLADVEGLDTAALAAPSLLPGWTRGHVLAHVARNADAYVNLLTSARTGGDIPAYASPAERTAGIESGAGRPTAIHLADLRAAAARFTEAVDAMPPQAWTVRVATPGGSRLAATLVWVRLREVEVHHVDLDAGYRTADWPEAFGQRLLHEVATDLAGRADAPALLLRPDETGQVLAVRGPGNAPLTVGGPAHELAGWLCGRSPGTGLTVVPERPLPTPPAWL